MTVFAYMLVDKVPILNTGLVASDEFRSPLINHTTFRRFYGVGWIHDYVTKATSYVIILGFWHDGPYLQNQNCEMLGTNLWEGFK